MADEEPKIIIDEGWKGQVQREREEAELKKAAAAEDGESDEAETPSEETPEDALPEASFEALLGGFVGQAMLALGAIAQPGEDRVMVDLDQAKFTIDLLGVLREKTEGNLAPEEEGKLREVLGELQRLYVARVQQFQEQNMRDAGIDLGNLKG